MNETEVGDWCPQPPREHQLRLIAILFLAALVVLPPILYALYPASVFHQPLWVLLPWIGAVVAVVAVHEGCHFVALRLTGARPRFVVLTRPFRIGVRAAGHRATRKAWITVVLAPAVVTIPLAVALAIVDRHTDGPFWLILAAAGGCWGDFSLVRLVLHNARPGDLIDDSDPRPGFHVLRRQVSVETPSSVMTVHDEHRMVSAVRQHTALDNSGREAER